MKNMKAEDKLTKQGKKVYTREIQYRNDNRVIGSLSHGRDEMLAIEKGRFQNGANYTHQKSSSMDSVSKIILIIFIIMFAFMFLTSFLGRGGGSGHYSSSSSSSYDSGWSSSSSSDWGSSSSDWGGSDSSSGFDYSYDY